MSDAKRSGAGSRRPAGEPPVDPRTALAQQYLQAAEAKLADEEAAQPRARRRSNAAVRTIAPSVFSLSVAPVTYVHIILVAISFTFAVLALTLTYHMLMVNFIVGRVIALPAGIIAFAALSYLSVCYLGIIESTSTGHTNVDALYGDWQEWFWTLPSSLGMVAIAAGAGWLLSLMVSVDVWRLIALCELLLYPVLQLSTLETGSPLTPLSLPVLRSLVRHPVAWLVLYAMSFAVTESLWLAVRAAWRDPPYPTILVMGPVITVALFVYAWLLGQLAHLFSPGERP